MAYRKLLDQAAIRPDSTNIRPLQLQDYYQFVDMAWRIGLWLMIWQARNDNACQPLQSWARLAIRMQATMTLAGFA